MLTANKLYIDNDNLLELDGLQDLSTGLYINDATVVATVCEDTVVSLDAEAIADKGGGKVGIQCDAHGLVSGDIIRITGTAHYNNQYTVDAATTENEIVVTATYVAETIGIKGKFYKAIEHGNDISLAYVAASDGKYQGILPNNAVLYEEEFYHIWFKATKGGNQMLMKPRYQASFLT